MEKQVTEEATLLTFLENFYPDSSKSSLRSWIKHGRVTVDGKRATIPSHPLLSGQSVKLWPTGTFMEANVRIVYEDPHFVVIDKPPSLLTVRTDLKDDLCAHLYLKKRYYPNLVYVVHRLDRETSGLMLFARTQEAFRGLKEALKRREIKREYLAVIEGCPQEMKGSWDRFLYERKDFTVVEAKTPEHGERAVTHFEVIATSKPLSLLHLKLETGRKHQIRVHCQLAGHPVVGDKKYGSKINPIKRMGLHSFRLQFQHPLTGKALAFETPYPDAFMRFDWKEV